MRVIDNIFDKETSDMIEDLLVKKVPWFYNENIAYGDDTNEENFGFSTTFSKDSPYADCMRELTFSVCNRIKFDLSEIMRVRGRMTFPKNNLPAPVGPHVDFEDDHFVLLYYVNDSDGPTYIFDRKYSTKNQELLDSGKLELNILKKVHPKRNRMLIFPGSYYHAASYPSVGKRVVLNINIKGKMGMNYV